uniref:Uncharacterized protein n=1 Tax=Panagrolaimus superbus TaxID=310955 RepID=A0A914YCS0_9BILA
MELPPKKPIVGCYVIGAESIWLSEDIPNELFCGSEDYVTYFQTACEKLNVKLECLVIVDHLLNNPELISAMFEIAKKYASVIYIIPAVVAILQRAVSHTCSILEERILVLINIGSRYLSYILEKDGSLLSPVDVQMNSLKSLQNNEEYAKFSSKPVFCITGVEMETSIREQLGIEFPQIKIYHFKHHLKSLVLGAFHKALCIAEPGKHLEIANFTSGIFSGTNPLVISCSKFPLKLHFIPSFNETMCFGDSLTIRICNEVRWCFKKVFFNNRDFDTSLYYLIEYDEFGFLKIEQALKDPFDIFYNLSYGNKKVQVWSIDKEKMGCFNFEKNFVQFSPLSQELKSLMNDEWLNDEIQVKQQLTEMHYDLVTVFNKIQHYKSGPIISIAPSYIGMLQYCLSLFAPTKSKLAIFYVSKIATKFYVLSQKSPLCYTVSYCINLSETYIDENIIGDFGDDVGLFYLTEKGSKRFLFIEKNFYYKFVRHEIEDFDELYGGAIYALQNSNKCLETTYVFVDPLLDPEENNCDHLSTVSKRTSTCFYEIEAFFNGALKLLKYGQKKFIDGDLIAILIRQHIFFFVHVNGKFLFKFDSIVSADQLITPSVLHFADVVIIGFCFGRRQISAEIQPCYFTWPVDYNIEEFLEDLNNDELLIYDTLPYAEAVTKAVGNKVYEKNIYQKCTMIIEFSENSCKIVLAHDEYVEVSGGMLLKDIFEHIPMYLSFCHQSSTRIGSDALEDLQNYPESVVYDFFKLLGTTAKTFPASAYDFKLFEMDNSDDPKLGYKVLTSKGEYQIISPEIAMKCFLQKLIFLYEKYCGKNVDEIKLVSESAFSNAQKECILEIGKKLKKEFIFSRY